MTSQLRATEVDINGNIGMGGFDAQELRGALADAKANGSKSIVVRLTSEGGDVTQGLAIYSMLKTHAAKVRVEVFGVAASMASIVAMAGDEIAMAEDAYMMIHNPWSGAGGDADELRDRADLLDNMKSTLVNIYARRTGQKKAAIVAAMNAETWMNAHEAKRLGYCTEVIPAKRAAARAASLQLTAGEKHVCKLTGRREADFLAFKRRKAIVDATQRAVTAKLTPSQLAVSNATGTKPAAFLAESQRGQTRGGSASGPRGFIATRDQGPLGFIATRRA